MSKNRESKRPLSKATVALNEQLTRRRGVRELAKRFLIVCEDGKSAPNYFESLKDRFNLSATSVKVVGGGGRTQPIQVVERAIELRDVASNPESGTEGFDQVWCVIDGDYGDKINNARAKATANGIKLAISTMCFEYWVLLHFEESDAATMDCDGVVKTLRKNHLKKYEKGGFDFTGIVDRAPDASKAAEKLRRPGIRRGDLPEAQNPCTEVYMLVNAILDSWQ